MSSLSSGQAQWLDKQLCAIRSAHTHRTLDIAFGMAPRRIGSQSLTLSDAEIKQLDLLITGWQVSRLQADTVARYLILNACGQGDTQTEHITRLLRHADLREQLALYTALPLYTPSIQLNDLLAEGLRSNIKDVFEAIAHDNPYPAWHLDEHRFNHMILKALFIDSTLSPIVGLHERNNPELARMLLDFARERRAASRPVSKELWTLTAPYMNADELAELQQEKTS